MFFFGRGGDSGGKGKPEIHRMFGVRLERFARRRGGRMWELAEVKGRRTQLVEINHSHAVPCLREIRLYNTQYAICVHNSGGGGFSGRLFLEINSQSVRCLFCILKVR